MYQCCRCSGMCIPNPGSWFLSILDPGSPNMGLGSGIEVQDTRNRTQKNPIPDPGPRFQLPFSLNSYSSAIIELYSINLYFTYCILLFSGYFLTGTLFYIFPNLYAVLGLPNCVPALQWTMFSCSVQIQLIFQKIKINIFLIFNMDSRF